MVPLAGPANKMGRIVADNIAGGSEVYRGTQGSSVAKVFDLTAASTGINEKLLQKKGLLKGKDYETVIIAQNDHAGYYPGALPMLLKLIFAKDGSRIFGAQIVGPEGVDKRIDTIGVAIRMGADIADLKSLELAYAPPYSSAKDPVNMAGFTAENVIRGLVRFCDLELPVEDDSVVLLDVREEAECMTFELPGSVNIPLEELRRRMGELDPSKTYITFCTIGVRSYNAARTMTENGFENVYVYPGGVRLYQTLFRSEDVLLKGTEAEKPVLEGREKEKKDMSRTKEVTVDCCGMQCPGPIMEVFKNIESMEDGDILKVTASDPGFSKDIVSWCRRTGNTLISSEKVGKEFVACIQKGQSEKRTGGENCSGELTPTAGKDGKTIVVFDNDMDKVLASFIIANGALAMKRPVTMFFTFWGLTVLRKEQKQPIKKKFTEKMFDRMLPRGPKKLALSKMNMGGMGTAMMKSIMKDKNVDSLEELMKKAMEAGVRIIACSMSMDVMGISEKELIDGVEIGGVGTYLGEAEESNVNLFI